MEEARMEDAQFNRINMILDFKERLEGFLIPISQFSPPHYIRDYNQRLNVAIGMISQWYPEAQNLGYIIILSHILRQYEPPNAVIFDQILRFLEQVGNYEAIKTAIMKIRMITESNNAGIELGALDEDSSSWPNIFRDLIVPRFSRTDRFGHYVTGGLLTYATAFNNAQFETDFTEEEMNSYHRERERREEELRRVERERLARRRRLMEEEEERQRDIRRRREEERIQRQADAPRIVNELISPGETPLNLPANHQFLPADPISLEDFVDGEQVLVVFEGTPTARMYKRASLIEWLESRIVQGLPVVAPNNADRVLQQGNITAHRLRIVLAVASAPHIGNVHMNLTGREDPISYNTFENGHELVRLRSEHPGSDASIFLPESLQRMFNRGNTANPITRRAITQDNMERFRYRYRRYPGYVVVPRSDVRVGTRYIVQTDPRRDEGTMVEVTSINPSTIKATIISKGSMITRNAWSGASGFKILTPSTVFYKIVRTGGRRTRRRRQL